MDRHVLQHKFPLEEGNTPLRQIAGIYYKLETANPTGSVKDRGVSHQVWQATAKGYTKFCISSSGNAAISAATYVSLAGGVLDAFVSPKINKAKLARLTGKNVHVHISNRPISDCIHLAKQTGAFNLRPSTDPNGWVGYTSIAYELDFKLGKVGSVFVPVSSGTLFLGLAEGFAKIGYLPQLFVVQSTYCNLIAGQFDSKIKRTTSSVADALVAKTTMLKPRIVSFVKKSKGTGYVVTDGEIKEAWRYLYNKNLATSYEGAACLAAYQKAVKTRDVALPVVCLITGKYYG
ncbi:MAG: hypothetical protein ACD_52C00270G0001 [uncultured bacterium]|nr:MAG: hypothetical protein ACD_52C00270G0001 [uncultured bacterium]